MIVASERSNAGNGVPPTPCFLAKSAETIENKGVVFFVSAKKCKRVRNDMKTQEIVRRYDGGLAGSRRWSSPHTLRRGGKSVQVIERKIDRCRPLSGEVRKRQKGKGLNQSDGKGIGMRVRGCEIWSEIGLNNHAEW